MHLASPRSEASDEGDIEVLTIDAGDVGLLPG